MRAVLGWERNEEAENVELSPQCPSCDETLILHQPDVELPDRLLATCENCKSWFLTNSESSVLVPIPLSAADYV
jgi:C4-type Zn-finger protein